MASFHRSSGAIGVFDRWSGWDNSWFRILLIVFTLVAFWVLGLSFLVPGNGLVELFVPPALAFVAMIVLPLITLAISNSKRLLMAFTVCYIFFSVAVWRNRDFADTSLDLQVMLQLAFWAYGGLLGVINLPILLRSLNSYLMAAVVAMMTLVCLSAAWSPDPTYSAGSAMLNVMFFLFAFTIAHKLDEREIVWTITIACLLVVVPSLAMSPFQNSFAEITGEGTAAVDRLRGMTGHPIGLALMCGVLLVTSFTLFYNRWGSRMFPLVFVGIALATLLLTQSRMPLAAALFAALAVPAYRLRIFGAASGPIFVLLGILAVIIAISGLEYFVPRGFLAMLSRTGEVDEILSLTGRSEIWRFVLTLIEQKPAFGWGIGSGEDVILPNFIDPTMNIMHAHNALLHFTYSTGIVGGLLLVIVLIIMTYKSFKYGSIFSSTLIVMLLISGLTEAAFANNRPNFMTFFLYTALGMCTQLGVSQSRGDTRSGGLRKRAPKRARVDWGEPETVENAQA